MLSSKEFLGLSYQFHADRIVISSENNRQHAHPMLHAYIHPSFKTNKQTNRKTEKHKNAKSACIPSCYDHRYIHSIML